MTETQAAILSCLTLATRLHSRRSSSASADLRAESAQQLSEIYRELARLYRRLADDRAEDPANP
jgi:hypothetical protein